MQAFDDVPYPLALGRDAAVAPEFSTSVAVTASGHERRASQWSDARLRFDVGPGVRSEEELGTLIAFFRARKGRAFGFRFRDWGDFEATDQQCHAVSATVFQLVKRYPSGPVVEIRTITRPVSGSVRKQRGPPVRRAR